jgi:hypothetical protein
MSAWARLVAKASPEELKELEAAMLEIQTETLRKAAARLRGKADQLSILRSEDARLKAEGLRIGADTIDPYTK